VSGAPLTIAIPNSLDNNDESKICQGKKSQAVDNDTIFYGIPSLNTLSCIWDLSSNM
jgi:hypothetical protein